MRKSVRAWEYTHAAFDSRCYKKLGPHPKRAMLQQACTNHDCLTVYIELVETCAMRRKMRESVCVVKALKIQILENEQTWPVMAI
jgi:hypothetical protein